MKKNIFLSFLPYLLWVIFSFAILFVKLNYHELWKDEWQAWFVAKEKNLLELFSFLYYEGHPFLWYIYLKVFSVFSSPEYYALTIQIAHWMVVVSFLYLFFVKFKLPILLKIAISLSYFIFFEYGIINRGYAVLIFLLFLGVLIIKEDKNKLYLSIVLFLLCQTEIYGLFCAVSLGCYLLLSSKNWKKRIFEKDFIGLFVGVVVTVVSIFPRDFSHLSSAKTKVLTQIDQSLMAIHGNLSYVFFIGSTPDVSAGSWSGLGLFLSIVILFLIYIIFSDNKPLLISLYIYLLLSVLFSMFLFVGGIRHWGIGFVFFIALLELLEPTLHKPISVTIISIFCFFSFIHMHKSLSFDISFPFTNAKIAGNFIKEKVPLNVPVVAINKFESVSVIGYAERPFYELPSGEPFYYFKWVDKMYIPTEAQLRMFSKYKNVGGLAILSHSPLEKKDFPTAELWKSFDSPNFKRENYYLYLLSR